MEVIRILFLKKLTDLLNQRSTEFFSYCIEHKKRGAHIFISIGLIMLLVFTIVPLLKRNIERQQVYALITQNYTSKKVEIIPDGSLNELISNHPEGVIVYFADPNSSQYDQIEKIVNDATQMKKFSSKLYIYPIVYDSKLIKETFQISAQPTFLYFEKGKEVNRLAMTDQEISLYFVRSLNTLPMANIKELNQ